MPSLAGCPARAALQTIAQETTVPTVDLLRHLACCPHCAAAVRQLLASLTGPLGPGALALAEAAGQMVTGHFESDKDLGAVPLTLDLDPAQGPTPSGTDTPVPTPSPDASWQLTPSLGQVPGREAAGYPFLSAPQGPGEIGWLGPFRVLGLLGEGAMGLVFRAEDTLLRRSVALKVLRPELAGDAALRRRFDAEARAVAALAHEHIVAIYRVGQGPPPRPGGLDLPWLAMELLHGQPLDRWLENNQPTLPFTLRLGREVALALAATHGRGLIHRDVKPGNIWVEEPSQRARLLDFGLVRAAEEQQGTTTQGLILGAPEYMAPEQADGAHVSFTCDLFSLGCVLYRLVAGVVPFPGQSLLAILRAREMGPPRPLHQRAANVPKALSGLVQQLLARAPGKRPASAQGVAEALARLEAGRRLLLPLPSSARRSRQGVLSGLALAVMLLAGVLGMVWPWLTRQTPPAPSALVTDTQREDSTPPRPEEPAKSEFYSLFNGKDLTGWEVIGKPGVWSVRNGVLVGESPVEEVAYTCLGTEQKDFTDFHLRAKIRINAMGTSGLFFRARTNGTHLPLGFEAAIRPRGELDATGRISLNHGQGRWPLLATFRPLAQQPKDWFVLEVIAQGSQLQTRVNGKVTAQVRSGASSRGGFFLEAFHRDTRIEIASLELRSLPPLTKPDDRPPTEEERPLNTPDFKVIARGHYQTGKSWGDRGFFARAGNVLIISTPSGVQVITPDNLKIVTSFSGHASYAHIMGLSVTMDGRMAISGGADTEGHGPADRPWSNHVFRLRDTATGNIVRVLDWPRVAEPVYASFAPDDQTVLCLSSEGLLNVYEVATGKLLRTWKVTAGSPVAFAPDSKQVLIPTDTGDLQLWDVKTGAVGQTFHGHEGKVTSVAFSPDGRWLISGGQDRTVRSWSVADGTEKACYRNQPEPVTSLATGPNGLALSGDGKTKVRLWSYLTGKEVTALDTTQGFQQGALAPDGRMAVIPDGGARSISVWELPEVDANR